MRTRKKTQQSLDGTASLNMRASLRFALGAGRVPNYVLTNDRRIGL